MRLEAIIFVTLTVVLTLVQAARAQKPRRGGTVYNLLDRVSWIAGGLVAIAVGFWRPWFIETWWRALLFAPILSIAFASLFLFIVGTVLEFSTEKETVRIPIRIVFLLAVLGAIFFGLKSCGANTNQKPPAGAALEILREHFMHDEVAKWLRDSTTRSSLRRTLAASGFRFVGTERQGGQEADGFSPSLRTGGTSPPIRVLTAFFVPGSEKPVALNVLGLTPSLQERAKQLLEFSLDSIEASSALSDPPTLHFLGGERLGPQRLLKVMLRVNRLKIDIYSVTYAMSAE